MHQPLVGLCAPKHPWLIPILTFSSVPALRLFAHETGQAGGAGAWVLLGCRVTPFHHCIYLKVRPVVCIVCTWPSEDVRKHPWPVLWGQAWVWLGTKAVAGGLPEHRTPLFLAQEKLSHSQKGP